MRITIAISASDRAATGIASCCRFVHGSTQGDTSSRGGCQWNTTPVTSSSIAASQKFGIDRPTIAIRRTTKSVAEFRFTAEITPSGTASSADRRTDSTASSAVSGSLRKIVPSTGSSLRSDIPRLPCAIWPIHLTYWTYIGWSRPYLARSSARYSAPTYSSGPIIRSTMSPGTIRIIKKTSSDTPTRTGKVSSSRLTTYVLTGTCPDVPPSGQGDVSQTRAPTGEGLHVALHPIADGL